MWTTIEQDRVRPRSATAHVTATNLRFVESLRLETQKKRESTSTPQWQRRRPQSAVTSTSTSSQNSWTGQKQQIARPDSATPINPSISKPSEDELCRSVSLISRPGHECKKSHCKAVLEELFEADMERETLLEQIEATEQNLSMLETQLTERNQEYEALESRNSTMLSQNKEIVRNIEQMRERSEKASREKRELETQMKVMERMLEAAKSGYTLEEFDEELRKERKQSKNQDKSVNRIHTGIFEFGPEGRRQWSCCHSYSETGQGCVVAPTGVEAQREIDKLFLISTRQADRLQVRPSSAKPPAITAQVPHFGFFTTMDFVPTPLHKHDTRNLEATLSMEKSLGRSSLQRMHSTGFLIRKEQHPSKIDGDKSRHNHLKYYGNPRINTYKLYPWSPSPKDVWPSLNRKTGKMKAVGEIPVVKNRPMTASASLDCLQNIPR